MNSKFIKTFAVIVIIAAGMTACGQKKNVTTDDVSEKETANIQETAAQEVTAQEIITQEITTEKEPENDEYVLVKKYIPDITLQVSEYMISQTHTFDTEQLRSLQMCRKN